MFLDVLVENQLDIGKNSILELNELRFLINKSLLH